MISDDSHPSFLAHPPSTPVADDARLEPPPLFSGPSVSLTESTQISSSVSMQHQTETTTFVDTSGIDSYASDGHSKYQTSWEDQHGSPVPSVPSSQLATAGSWLRSFSLIALSVADTVSKALTGAQSPELALNDIAQFEDPASSSSTGSSFATSTDSPSIVEPTTEGPHMTSLLDNDRVAALETSEADNNNQLLPGLQDVLSGRDTFVCTYPGTSQYARGAPSACGLASMNAARIVLSLEQGSTDGCPLLRPMAERSTMEEIMRIASFWSGANHLDITNLHALPLFATSLELTGIIFSEPVNLDNFMNLLMRMIRTSDTTLASMAAVITKPPETVAVFVIKALGSQDSHTIVIFDSHTRSMHPEGAAFLFFPSAVAGAAYLNDLFHVREEQLADVDDDIQRLQLRLFDAYLFAAKADVPAAEESIYEANMRVLSLTHRVEDLRNEYRRAADRLENHREALRLHTEAHEKVLQEAEEEKTRLIAQMQDMTSRHRQELERTPVETHGSNEQQFRALREQLEEVLDENARLQRQQRELEQGHGHLYDRQVPGRMWDDRTIAQEAGPSTTAHRTSDYGRPTTRVFNPDPTAEFDDGVSMIFTERPRINYPTRPPARASTVPDVFWSPEAHLVHAGEEWAWPDRGSVQQRTGTNDGPSLLQFPPMDLYNAHQRSHPGPALGHDHAVRLQAQEALHLDDRALRREAEDEFSSNAALAPDMERVRTDADIQRLFATYSKTFDCGICLETLSEEDVAIVETCGHRMCRDCLKSHIVSKLGDNRFPVLCPSCALDTGIQDVGVISGDLAELVGLCEDEYMKWVEFEMATHSVRINCRGCQQMAYVDRVEYSMAETIRCPLGCGHVWCKLCGQHVSLNETHSCDGTAELNRAMAANGWKACPGCGTPIEKTEGCNHITCSVPGCTTHFCYLDGHTIVRSVQRNEINAALEAHYNACRMFDY